MKMCESELCARRAQIVGSRIMCKRTRRVLGGNADGIGNGGVGCGSGSGSGGGGGGGGGVAGACIGVSKLNVTFLYCILFSLMVCFCDGLKLSAFTTKSPRVTKYTTKPPTQSSSMNHDATASIYRFNATNGITCILISVDGLISIKYRNKLNEDVEADLYMPDDPQLSGECVESNVEYLTLEFKGFKLSMIFKKSSGGEGWYINQFELTYSSSNKLFEHPDRPGLNVRLISPPHQPMFFPTPVGKAYVCDKEQKVIMYAPLDSGDQSGHIAHLYLRDLQMQSFMFKESGKWGPPFHCSATGSYRDETAPLAVGTALAIAVLLTISGYGGWRYFKVKKVQYGSME